MPKAREDLLETKGLPANLEVEKVLLGALLIDPSAIGRVRPMLDPSDFSSSRHRTIYESMLDISQNGNPLDRVTVADELQSKKQLQPIGGLSYLVSLDDGLPQVYNPENYAKIVRDLANRRRLIYFGQQVVDTTFQQTDTPTVELISKFEKSLGQLGSTTAEISGKTLAEYIDTYEGGLDRLLDATKRKRGISTGFLRLDDMIGGLMDGMIFTIAARPGIGKTAMALCLARNVATITKKRCIMFSLEMGLDPLFDRLLSRESRVSSKKMRRGELDQTDRTALMRAVTDLRDTNIVIDDTPGMDIRHIQQVTAAHRIKEPIAAVFIDYVQLMALPKGVRVRDKYEKMAHIANDIYSFAKSTQIPVIALSQLRRPDKGSKKPQGMEDMRGAGEFEEMSWVAGILHREEKDDRADLQNIVEMIIDKNRLGERGTIKFQFNGATSEFSEYE